MSWPILPDSLLEDLVPFEQRAGVFEELRAGCA